MTLKGLYVKLPSLTSSVMIFQCMTVDDIGGFVHHITTLPHCMHTTLEGNRCKIQMPNEGEFIHNPSHVIHGDTLRCQRTM